jgi:hypothetical protein
MQRKGKINNTVEDKFRTNIFEEITGKNMISHTSNQNLSYKFKYVQNTVINFWRHK